MTIESQVCSLDLAKRLKKLGVKQGSLFYWYQYKDGSGKPVLKDPAYRFEVPDYSKDFDSFAAFTVAELGELIPPNWPMPMKYQCGDWWCEAPCQTPRVCQGHNTEANARATMLGYLIEEGSVKP